MLIEIIKYITSKEKSSSGNTIKSFFVNNAGEFLEYFIEIKNEDGDINSYRVYDVNSLKDLLIHFGFSLKMWRNS